MCVSVFIYIHAYIRTYIHTYIHRWYTWAVAWCGFAGTVAACLQHELVLRGWLIDSIAVDTLKICNTIFSVVYVGKELSPKFLPAISKSQCLGFRAFE